MQTPVAEQPKKVVRVIAPTVTPQEQAKNLYRQLRVSPTAEYLPSKRNSLIAMKPKRTIIPNESTQSRIGLSWRFSQTKASQARV